MLNRWLNMKKTCPRKRIKKSENIMQKAMDSNVCGIFDSLNRAVVFHIQPAVENHRVW